MRTSPPLAFNSVTELPVLFATQMFVPSYATADGCPPTANGPSVAPVVALTSVTLLVPVFATQMFVPSKARPEGCDPTVTVFSTAPDTGSSFTTFPSADSVTHNCDPFEREPFGAAPASAKGTEADAVGYQCRVTTWSGFFPPVVTPVAEATLDSPSVETSAISSATRTHT